METHTEGSNGGWPRGVTPVGDFHRRDASELGEEATDLGRLAAAGVPMVFGVRVELGGADGEARLLETVNGVFHRGAAQVLLRPLFPNPRLRERFARLAGPTLIPGPDAAPAMVRVFLEAVGAPDLLGALGGALSRLGVWVHAADPERRGGAASVDPENGDPETLAVWMSRAAPWYVDRRTARVIRGGEGPLDAHEASLVADLVDRAQLVLEHPVAVDWTREAGRFAVAGVSALQVLPSFSSAPYRILTLVAADEGTVAPLAIDALDRALSRDDDPSAEPRVRRIYARPYRRQDDTDRDRRPMTEFSMGRLAVRAARVAKDVAVPLAAVRRFEKGLAARLVVFDGQPLEGLDHQALLRELWDRQRMAVEAFILLDRQRLSTIAVLAALEMAGGAVPRESFPAIARPRHTRERRRMHDRLRRLAEALEEEVGHLRSMEGLPLPLRRRVDEMKEALRDVRPLGIDVCPDAIGASDANLLAALRAVKKVDEGAFRSARRAELRRIRQTATGGPFGRTRDAFVSSFVLLQSRVSRSKGVAVEGLAAVLLRVRRAAVEVGRRLVDAGILDDAEDALYMDLPELEEALRGEPGAYASRVRLRREDDARWARFEAPRRIESRRPHHG